MDSLCRVVLRQEGDAEEGYTGGQSLGEGMDGVQDVSTSSGRTGSVNLLRSAERLAHSGCPLPSKHRLWLHREAWAWAPLIPVCDSN